MEKYYRHFKGGVYRLLNIARDSETQEKVVVYQAMYGDGDIWTRPFDMFFGKVRRNGIVLDRFAPISEKDALAHVPIELNPKYHFPEIEYRAEMPTMINPDGGFSRGVKAMVTLLLKNHIVPNTFFEGIQNDDDIEKEAWHRILSYKNETELEDIFHLIQAWGGNSGRGIYVYGKGFDWNRIKQSYFVLANSCLRVTEINDETIDYLLQSVKRFDREVLHLGISFITKHVRFWSYRPLGNDALPIYDRHYGKRSNAQKCCQRQRFI